jgi:hypothetical protein
MHLARRLWLVLVAVAIVIRGPDSLCGQDIPLRVGDVVRIALVAGSPLVGTLTLADSTELEVRDSSGISVSVPVSEIRVVERRLCTGCSGSKAVHFGAAIGFLALGSFGAYVAHGLCENDDCHEVPAFFVGGVIGLAPGAAIGGIAGSTHSGDRWEAVPLAPRGSSDLTFGIVPTRAGRTTFIVRLGL